MKKGKMIPPEHERQMQKAYDLSLNFLALRDRSVKEVKEYLYKKKFNSEIIELTLLTLQENRLLDDDKFAQEFIHTREKIRPKSKFALRYELKNKGVCDTIIEKQLDRIDEYKSAYNAIGPKISTWLQLEKKIIKNKMFGFLKNRGFNWEVSKATWEKFSKDIMDKEPDK